MSERRQLEKIPVADFVFCQQHEMIVAVTLSLGMGFCGVAVSARTARDHIHLVADDRLDSRLPGFLVKLDRAEHHAMISERERRHVMFYRRSDQIVYCTGGIEQRVMRMIMKMYEISHGVAIRER